MIPAYKNILFDLDGTVVDSGKGIVRCVQYAANQLSRDISQKKHKIQEFIGVPLNKIFAYLFNSDDDSLLREAVAHYRTCYKTKGIYENKLYDGMEDLLVILNDIGARVFLATAKPGVFAEKIIEHLKLSKYFEEIYGSELDGTRVDKGELIEFIMKESELKSEGTVMIGDREGDIIAAGKHGLDSIGVTYGFGAVEELEAQNPTYICNSCRELIKALTKTD